jgi:hypothetical protein
MERFKSVAEFVMIGLLPVTLCGVVYLAEVLGN